MFRKIIFAIIVLMVAQQATAQKAVTISGSYDKAGDGVVKLFRVEDGKIVQVATCQAGQNRKFGFHFFPAYNGWYVIGTGNERNNSDNYTVYLKEGDELEISIKQNNYSLSGTKNTRESKIVHDWQTMADQVYQKSVNFSRNSSTFTDFFPQLEKLVNDAQVFLKAHANRNTPFSRQLKELVSMDLLNYSNQFLNTPRSVHPEVAQFSAYYNTIRVEELTSHAASFYNYPWGNRTLSSVLMTAMRQKGIIPGGGPKGFSGILSMVSNDTLKGDLALERMASVKGYDEYQQYLDLFGKFMITANQEREKLKQLQALEPFKPGMKGYNFSATDSAGNTIQLKQLAGKLVLVDCWATWCGPCKKEEPYWEKLTERFAGKDIVFTGLSIDEDKTAWKKYMAEKKLKGLQLHIGTKNEFSSVYKTSAIPRYLLFDRSGNVITTDSPRPSDEALAILIEEWLKK
ncbi:TlpA family protein disulfide reductase [Pseudoflavitalea sp. G-6-1-2]|uniref:TlpA family protein disulfide reductase n=1 Tax=Pseudoflavitalea sp. G-6-1-2 TaxID=2728841 RepID=UPI00146BD3E5|nr:TlpA disulfide reductase family protein [Pseudoflavitalea sp. G-6-1-2]NML23031.1 TlpA family protein disulfide reductase [Pseudoflavitalea sp. G-6-1-2]